METENKNEIKPFSMNLATLKRIDLCLTLATESSIKGNIMVWGRALSAIHKDIHYLLNPSENKEYFERYAIIVKALQQIKQFPPRVETKKEQDEIYRVWSVAGINLEQQDTFLRDLLWKYKLMMAEVSDMRYTSK